MPTDSVDHETRSLAPCGRPKRGQAPMLRAQFVILGSPVSRSTLVIRRRNVMPDTSKEAVLKVLRGQKADHVPNFSGMGSITLQGIQSLGYRFNEIHVDGQKMAASAATTYRLYGVESAVVPFDMGVVAESLGATVKYYDKADLGQIIYPTMPRTLIARD